MSDIFKQLVDALKMSPLSTDVLHQILLIVKQQTDELLSSFVSESFQSLLSLQDGSWQLLSQNSHEWINESYCDELLHTLASFNKNLIFNNDNIVVDNKAFHLFPVSIDQINNIFKQIESSNDDNDPFITIASLWLDNHSYSVHENPHCNKSSYEDMIACDNPTCRWELLHQQKVTFFCVECTQIQQLQVPKRKRASTS